MNRCPKSADGLHGFMFPGCYCIACGYEAPEPDFDGAEMDAPPGGEPRGSGDATPASQAPATMEPNSRLSPAEALEILTRHGIGDTHYKIVAERLLGMDARIADLEGALRELLELKDHVKHRDPLAYADRKPRAWARARALLWDPHLHPSGRCTCCGEGACEFCRRADATSPTPPQEET